MSGGRHTVPVDVHLLAVRDGDRGPEVLLSRRAGDVYARGLWHAPSGHVELETVVDAVVRETLEETGLVVDAADVRAAVTVHHRPPGGQARVGIFFEVRRWSGTPRVVEKDKCDAIGWFALDGLPAPMVAYCRAGIDAYRAGAPVALHFQEPGDAIAHDPAADRLAVVPGHADRSTVPEDAVRAFAEQAVGRITTWSDVPRARAESRVWRACGAWYVKVHQNDRFHRREVAALRGWVSGLGAAAPRLVAAAAELRAVMLTAVGGRSLQSATYPPEEQRRIFRRIGQLAAAIHTSAPARSADGMLPLGKLERHLTAPPYRLVAHHASTEAGIIARQAEHCPVLATTPLLDTLRLAKAMVPGLGSYGLNHLLAFYGIPQPAGRHRAIPDVEVTAQVLARLLEKGVPVAGGARSSNWTRPPDCSPNRHPRARRQSRVLCSDPASYWKERGAAGIPGPMTAGPGRDRHPLTSVELFRAMRGGGLGETLRGIREGWTTRHMHPRCPMSWRTVYRLTASGRPPIV